MKITELLQEDWQKVNKHDKTDGLSQKAVNAYRRENPGSKLKTAVTTKPSKLKKGSKSAKRRKSFCARMSGMKKHRAGAKTKRDPDSPINKALRRWNCESIEEMRQLIEYAESVIAQDRQLMEIKKGQKDSNGFTKCWPGKHAEGTKKGKNGGQVRNCVPNESVAEGLDPIKKERLKDLIDQYRNATDPEAYYGLDDEYPDPDEVIAQIRDEFGDKVANSVEQGPSMHFPRPHHSMGHDKLAHKTSPRVTKSGKLNRQDSDSMKQRIKQDFAEVFDDDKETGTTHKGGIVTKTKHGIKHTKTDYDDGNPSIGQRKEPSSRWKQTKILDKDDDLDEAANAAQQAAIAISMKKAGKKPKAK